MMKVIWRYFNLFFLLIVANVNSLSAQDLNKNWVANKSYDLNGNVISESKSFFDFTGIPTQTQVKNLSAGQVLASEQLYDPTTAKLIASSLPAPINNSEFSYKEGFFAVGPYYDLIHGVVNNNIAGTLGWYYSENNNLESHVAATSFPFFKKNYNNEANPGLKSESVPGEDFVIGSRHDSRSFVSPVLNELNFYIQVRNKFFSASSVGNLPMGLNKKSCQQINMDANGKMQMTVLDLEGKVLMSALEGNELTVTNELNIADEPSFYVFPGNSTQAPLSAYYYLSEIYNDTYVDIDDGLVPTNLNPGNYTFLGGTGTFQYTNHYGNINFNYYNQLGQLIATIAPEGVKKLIENINAYTTLADVPFVNTYEYDLQGRMIANTSTDAGRTEYIYRLDGNIRFSQNTEQRKTGRFSYTNYDELGRPVESGEYIPGDVTFSIAKTNNTIKESIQADGGLTGGTKRQWVRTHYDFADNSHGLSYTQDEFNLRGAVSWTENENAKTWYNYDENGRVIWTIKQITGLGNKTIDYSYNAQGNVSKVDYQKGTAAERFVHEYEYDADGRLKVAYTSIDDVTRKEQARYSYYLHGPLKRVELAENLQGIDYTYTLQGMLKSINHPLQANDPGHDGSNGFAPDVFGMTLEYFNGDYNRASTNITSLSTGGTQTSYAGNIMAQTWRSTKPDAVSSTYGTSVNDPVMFTYEYDNKYQFDNNKYGTPNFSTNTFQETLNKNREHGLTYDKNGNILTLNRTDESGNNKDNFIYHYQTNTNRLDSVDNYASYQYDGLGQLVGQIKPNNEISIVYDVTGKVIEINSGIGVATDRVLGDSDIVLSGQSKIIIASNSITLLPGFSAAAGSTVQLKIQSTPLISYTYDEAGIRISKTNHSQNITTYYIPDASGNVMAIYDNNGTALQQKEIPVYAASRIGMYNKTGNTYQYELTDHLGNVRVVINQNKINGLADVAYYSDYYPYGSPLTLANNDYRYGYQGQYVEKDKETTWNAFELRNYDAAIGRWLSVDPYGQYASPYLGMGNNPVSGIDPDGGFDTWLGAALYKITHGGSIGKNVDGTYNVSKAVYNNDKFEEINIASGRRGYSIANSFESNLWNSQMRRSITGDKIGFNVGVDATNVVGVGLNFEFNWILTGKDKSFYPYFGITPSFNLADGVNGSIDFTLSKSWYSGKANNVTAESLPGPEYGLSIGGKYGFGGDIGYSYSPDGARGGWHTASLGFGAGIEFSPVTVANIKGSVSYNGFQIHTGTGKIYLP